MMSQVSFSFSSLGYCKRPKADERGRCDAFLPGVSDFLEYHPGGAGVILKKAGQDATYVCACVIVKIVRREFGTDSPCFVHLGFRPLVLLSFSQRHLHPPTPTQHAF
jgi:hypothetical protein